MNKKAIFALVILSLASCSAPRSETNKLRIGMPRNDVQTIMGEPDSSAAIQGKGDCYYYSMWRDFWNRQPGNYSDRYYVCFRNDEVSAYGRVGDPIQ